MMTRTNRTLRLCGWGILALAVIAVVPAWGAIFTDIVGMPAQRAIERLAAKGIFKLNTDKFNPAGTVPRGEFAVLLARVLGTSGEGVPLPAFKDAAEIPKEMQPAVRLSPISVRCRRSGPRCA